MNKWESFMTKRKNKRKEHKLDLLLPDLVKFSDLVNQHLVPCSDDLILLTLKGHLIIENLLEMNLCNLLAVERLAKKKGRLGFAQKLALVQVVVEHREPGPNADLFCVIEKLNDLRNQIAHNLKEPGEIEVGVKDFIKEYHAKSGEKMRWDKPLSAQLKEGIGRLCGFLWQVRQHAHDLAQNLH
jgi:hypothetical protein